MSCTSKPSSVRWFFSERFSIIYALNPSGIVTVYRNDGTNTGVNSGHSSRTVQKAEESLRAGLCVEAASLADAIAKVPLTSSSPALSPSDGAAYHLVNC